MSEIKQDTSCHYSSLQRRFMFSIISFDTAGPKFHHSFEGIKLWKSTSQQLHDEKNFFSSSSCNILFILYFHVGWWLGNLSGIRICKEIPQCKLTKREASVAKCKKEKHLRQSFNPSMSCQDHFFLKLTQWCLDWSCPGKSVMTNLPEIQRNSRVLLE